MPDRKKVSPKTPKYLPTMTQDYSQISDTAKAVNSKVLPGITSYIQSIASQIAGTNPETPFVIADYGAADGINSSELFEKIIKQIHSINPLLIIRLVYNDIAKQELFDRFWKSARLAQLEGVEAQYIKRSFYEPFPELSGKLNLGFSSTSLHWLDTRTTNSDLFQHPGHIQANQLPDSERRQFVEKWKEDWKLFFRERNRELVNNGALFLANLADFDHDQFPASTGYNFLRDVCRELCQEGQISREELNAIFIPDYFATPQEMKSLLDENDLKQFFFLKSCDEMTVPCAYFSQFEHDLDNNKTRNKLADTLAHVVRAWSESSISTGLSAKNKDKINIIYKRLGEKFYKTPKGLPYQYCLLELIKK